MGKAVARHSKLTIAQECLNDHTIWYDILNINICSEMCAKKTNSVLKQEEPENMEEFCWDNLLTEVQAHAPTLLYFMNACTKTRKHRSNWESTIGMCIAMRLKYRYNKMCCFFWWCLFAGLVHSKVQTQQWCHCYHNLNFSNWFMKWNTSKYEIELPLILILIGILNDTNILLTDILLGNTFMILTLLENAALYTKCKT